MSHLDIALAVIGIVVLAIGLWSIPIKRSPVQEPMIAMAAGIVAGPYGFGWIDVSAWGDQAHILEQASRITLAIGLMGVALRLSKDSLRRLLRPVSILLTFGMLGMWLASSLLASLLLGLPLWMALLVGAAVTPTDPVVASSIVTGRFARQNLPLHVRDTISFESGANDGLAYLLLMLPLLMIEHPPVEVWRQWLVHALLIGLGGAVIIGCATGYAAARLLSVADRRGWIESPSFLSFTIALSLFTLGAAQLLEADALISVFLAGLLFNLLTRGDEERQEENIQEAIVKLFTLPMFIIFGSVLPIDGWVRLGWPLLALSVLVLLLRRPPVLAALFLSFRRTLNARDTAFVAWFGPIGVAAMYYSLYAQNHLQAPVVWHVGSALIAASILVHGMTAAPFIRVYAAPTGKSLSAVSGPD